jgi:hypothetical protein
MSTTSGDRAFSSEVDTGSRQENASIKNLEPVPIPSERKGLLAMGHGRSEVIRRVVELGLKAKGK